MTGTGIACGPCTPATHEHPSQHDAVQLCTVTSPGGPQPPSVRCLAGVGTLPQRRTKSGSSCLISSTGSAGASRQQHGHPRDGRRAAACWSPLGAPGAYSLHPAAQACLLRAIACWLVQQGRSPNRWQESADCCHHGLRKFGVPPYHNPEIRGDAARLRILKGVSVIETWATASQLIHLAGAEQAKFGHAFFLWKGLQVYKETGRDRPAGVQSPTSTGKHQHHRRPKPSEPQPQKGTPRGEEDLKPNTTEQEEEKRPKRGPETRKKMMPGATEVNKAISRLVTPSWRTTTYNSIMHT